MTIQVAATGAITNPDEVEVVTTASTMVTVGVVPPDPATHAVVWVIYLETAFKHRNASIAVKSVTSVETAPNPNQRPVTTAVELDISARIAQLRHPVIVLLLENIPPVRYPTLLDKKDMLLIMCRVKQGHILKNQLD